jgi:hypothetical protein
VYHSDEASLLTAIDRFAKPVLCFMTSVYRRAVGHIFWFLKEHVSLNSLVSSHALELRSDGLVWPDLPHNPRLAESSRQRGNRDVRAMVGEIVMLRTAFSPARPSFRPNN